MAEPNPKREWIAGLSSCIVHLLVLLVLAAWSVGVGSGLSGNSISIESGDAWNAEVEAIEIASAEIEATQAQSVAEAESLASSPAQLERMASAVREMSTEETDVDEIRSDLLGLSATAGGGGSVTGVEISLSGRSAENRERLVKENGGSPESERAVELALEYLAQHQLNDGAWSMMYSESCDGQCTPSCSGRDPYRYAATGLALLCFLGAGKTSEDEQYGLVVSKGVYFLQQNLRSKSDSAYWLGTEAGAQMYEHGIATLALCEAYQMMRSAELKDSCQLAINFIVLAQFKDGGWDYHPNAPGDLSIAGWQAMALKSAVSAKLNVPTEALRGIDRFLDKTRAGEFMFKYRTNKPTKSMTAIGVLLQIFRGRSKDARGIERGIQYLSKQGPSLNDLYYDYYATQAMFQIGGNLWKNWNYKMRDHLVRTQVASGHMQGSWSFEDDHSNRVGGRLYATCMACLILEVYYRYLPVYRETGNDFQF